MKSKLPSGTLERLWNNPQNWRGYLFYVCPEDPRYLVPKRQKWRGWTVNFGRPGAGLLLAFSIIGTIAPLLILMALRLFAFLPAALIIIVLIACACGFYFSSPSRFEE